MTALWQVIVAFCALLVSFVKAVPAFFEYRCVMRRRREYAERQECERIDRILRPQNYRFDSSAD